MAATPTQNSQGDQVIAALDTVYTLATITSAGVYVLALDLNAIVADDILVVRVQYQVQTTGQGGAAQLLHEWSIFGTTMTEKVWMSYPIPSLNSIAFTLEQTDGTGRTIPWEILAL